MAQVHSFSSAPRAVTTGKYGKAKYRAPGESLDSTVYREVKETCISWDKRVHRGNTYSVHTQKAIQEALDEAMRPPELARTRKRSTKEPSIFAMGLPEAERVEVDLAPNLIAVEFIPEVSTVEAQTDEFLPEPPPEQFQPQKTGINASTQVEQGDIFNWDWEVEPILDTLVNKTLEQSVMEVEEEFELEEMAAFRKEWLERQQTLMQDHDAQIAEEWVRWEAKEQIVKEKMEQKRREAQVLLKIQALAAAKNHLRNLVPNAVSQLNKFAFANDRELAIQRLFLPNLMSQAREQAQARQDASRLLDDAVKRGFEAFQAEREPGRQLHHERRLKIDKDRFEEAQIRRGIIRIYVPDEAGGSRLVGPVELRSSDEVEGIEDNIMQWMRKHAGDLVPRFQHGATLMLGEKRLASITELFESKVGQVSLRPRTPPPPPPRVEGAEEAEEEGKGADGDDA